VVKRTPLKRSNPRRRARLYARNFGERRAFIVAMPCLLEGQGCAGIVEPAHTTSRGAGGDRRKIVPLCTGHHREQGDRGIKTFSAHYQIDLHAHAARIAADLDARGVP
jgi:hypothetical protein